MNKRKMIVLYIMIGLIFIECLYALWENTHFTLTEYEYTNARIPTEMDGLRILQISDLHNQSYGRDNKRLLRAIRNADAHVIVITGDLVDSTFTDTEEALSFAEALVQIAPVYYCTGNHEHRLPPKDLRAFLQGLSQRGVRVLSNEAIPFYGGTLVGLKDPDSQKHTLRRILRNEESDSFTLLLSHKPHHIENYQEADLVLAGHAHGGQARLPLIGGIIAPGQGYFPKYTEGFYTMGNTTMLVSRGIGNSHRLPRFFNMPELVLLTLRSQ